MRITAPEIAMLLMGKIVVVTRMVGGRGLWELLVSGGTQRQRASRARGSSHE